VHYANFEAPDAEHQSGRHPGAIELQAILFPLRTAGHDKDEVSRGKRAVYSQTLVQPKKELFHQLTGTPWNYGHE
jgi:hypothetical protein